MSQFERLTKYIPAFQTGAYGDWVIDTENDGSSAHPLHMPYVSYNETVYQFMDDVHAFILENPDLGLTDYRGILEANGLGFDLAPVDSADVSSLDAQAVLALLTSAVRAERFCDGALLSRLTNGCLVKWLLRLQELETSERKQEWT